MRMYKLALLLFSTLWICCGCDIDRYKPEDNSRIFLYGYECDVNGSHYSELEYDYYPNERDYMRIPEPRLTGWGFSGVNNNLEADFSKLAFNVLFPGLALHIKGDGKGPFKAGVNYSSIYDFVLYHPSVNINDGIGEFSVSGLIRGYSTKILSSSFRFDYGIKEEPGVGNVLLLFFEFEEVIKDIPEGCSTWPFVGDTVRVTNGIYTQSLYFQTRSNRQSHNLDKLHKIIVPM